MLGLFNQIFTPANVVFMMNGLKMTVIIAVLSTAISIVFGVLLALIRTYSRGGWRWAGTLVAVYTESFRCTPNLLWILWIYFTVRGNKIGVCVFAISLFTSAVMAEIFRGGLNAVPKGQFEAARSQGFSFCGTLWYIVLPQMFRKVIPALLSQVITVIKDTSFLKMVDVAEFMRNCGVVLGSIYDVRGMLMLFCFEAACYFSICFALSCVVRTYQKTIAAA